MRVFNALIFFYVLGYLIFLTKGEFDKEVWYNTFHLWRNICHGGLLVWAAFYYVGNAKVKAKAKWMFWFSACLVLWEIIHQITGVNINDSIAVFILFLCLVFTLIILLIREHRKY